MFTFIWTGLVYMSCAVGPQGDTVLLQLLLLVVQIQAAILFTSLQILTRVILPSVFGLLFKNLELKQKFFALGPCMERSCLECPPVPSVARKHLHLTSAVCASKTTRA